MARINEQINNLGRRVDDLEARVKSNSSGFVRYSDIAMVIGLVFLVVFGIGFFAGCIFQLFGVSTDAFPMWQQVWLKVSLLAVPFGAMIFMVGQIFSIEFTR